MLQNVKMPRSVGTVSFISKMNTTSEIFKARRRPIYIFQKFSFYKELKFHSRLS